MRPIEPLALCSAIARPRATQQICLPMLHKTYRTRHDQRAPAFRRDRADKGEYENAAHLRTMPLVRAVPVPEMGRNIPALGPWESRDGAAPVLRPSPGVR